MQVVPKKALIFRCLEPAAADLQKPRKAVYFEPFRNYFTRVSFAESTLRSVLLNTVEHIDKKPKIGTTVAFSCL